jgi:molybdopterin molybdotransferase
MSASRAAMNVAPAARTLMPVEQALARLLDGLGPVGTQEIALAEAAGLVLAEPLIVPEPVPRAAIALRAGFALAAADSFGASHYSPMSLPRLPQPVAAGEALPAGTDSVVEAEALTILRGRAEIAEPVTPGAWARRAGEDAAEGAILCRAGARLRPHQAAAARLAGVTMARIRQPRVALLGSDPSLDLVAAFVRLRGAALLDPEDGPDLLVGVDGPGALPAGAHLVAGALALRPGELARLARLGATPIVLIPPQPDAALALALTIILPVLDHLADAGPEPAPHPAPLSRKITSTIGFTEIALLARTGEGWAPLAVGDLPLGAIAAADAWLAIPAGLEGYPAGHPVAALPL